MTKEVAEVDSEAVRGSNVVVARTEADIVTFVGGACLFGVAG